MFAFERSIKGLQYSVTFIENGQKLIKSDAIKKNTFFPQK